MSSEGHVYLYYFRHPDPVPVYDRTFQDCRHGKIEAGRRVLHHNRRGRIAFTMTNETARPAYY